MKLNELWQQSTEQTERFLRAHYQAHSEPQEQLFSSMSYSLMAGGKRLRPFLVREFCAACGGERDRAQEAAAAVEMIHTYSLIHDDLPCMDDDDLRRGKPTNHKVYGEALAVLAGDGLLTDAFSVLTSSASLTDTERCRCVQLLARAAGPWGMVGGQTLDMESESRACTPEEVIAIQSRKTGQLIWSACAMGVVCGGGGMQQEVAARQYAEGVGLAFQIQDDILDITGEREKLGKATGVDQNKNTFVRIYGVERCKQLVQEQTQKAVTALDAFSRPEVLRELAFFLASREY